MSDNPFVGTWNYRSLHNNPDDINNWNELAFGSGVLKITAPSSNTLAGTIGSPAQSGWRLNLHGSISYGSPGQIRFQGSGVVGGEKWVYDYIGWLVPVWPNSNDTLQRAAIVGSVVRTAPHSGGDGTVHQAGVVASFYAVRME